MMGAAVFEGIGTIVLRGGIRQTWERMSRPDMIRVVDAIVFAYRVGKKIIAMGNGGMAATAPQLVADFVKHPFVSAAKDRVAFAGPRLQAVCLSDSIGTVTSWADDVRSETSSPSSWKPGPPRTT